MKTPSFSFIVNPISGTHRHRERMVAAIKQLFRDHTYQLVYTEYPGHATLLAAEAAQSGVDVVVAVGGDGTMNETASGLVGTQTALGLLPRGSGNGFARSMGVPLQKQQALQTILKCRTTSVDVGIINDGYFFGVAGVGLDAEIAHAFQNFGKRGPLPYYYVGLRAFKQYGFDSIKIVTDDHTEILNPLLITVANTQQYGNGAIIAPQADFTDGLLDVCIVERFSLSTVVPNLRQLFTGKITKSPYYRSFKTKAITILQEDGKERFHVDGEPRTGGQKLQISVRPKALRVCLGKIKSELY